MPTSDEFPIVIPCAGERLLGILHPADGPTGIVMIVGGPQYRAGSHRAFVHVARAMAAAGFTVLRFDTRGMGDSSGSMPGFENLDPDVAAAIDALLVHAPGVGRVVLWGLCDAAAAALLYLDRQEDVRVAALCLLNPWVRSASTLARTQVRHYYGRRLIEPAFWLKLLRGQVSPVRSLGGLWRSLCAFMPERRPTRATVLPFQSRMARAWRVSPRPIMLALSGNDFTAKEFLEAVAHDPDWSGALDRPEVHRLDLAAADHTFSDLSVRLQLERATVDWLRLALPSEDTAAALVAGR